MQSEILLIPCKEFKIKLSRRCVVIKNYIHSKYAKFQFFSGIKIAFKYLILHELQASLKTLFNGKFYHWGISEINFGLIQRDFHVCFSIIVSYVISFYIF